MPTQPTPATLPDLLRFYLRGALDDHSFKTHLLLILIDQAEGQALLKALLDAAVAELQVQGQDMAVLAAHVDVALPSQRKTAAGTDEPPPDSPPSAAANSPD